MKNDVHPGPPSGTPQQRIEQWVASVPQRLDRLRKTHLPTGFPFSLAPDSLEPLEVFLLGRFREKSVPDASGVALDACAYVGEIILDTIGGEWAWARTKMYGPQPVIGLDPAFAEDRVAALARTYPHVVVKDHVVPMAMIDHACRAGSWGTDLIESHRHLRGLAERHAEKHPGWRPTRRPTPGVDALRDLSPGYEISAVNETGSDIYALHDWLEELETISEDMEWPHPERDFTPCSLAGVEAELLEDHHRDTPASDDDSFHAYPAYLGEVLLRLAGGRWGWHADPALRSDGTAVIIPDPALGLDAIAPRLVAHHAIRARTGREFTALCERVREAVQAYRTEHPGWEPVRGEIPERPDWGDNPRLNTWLAEREAAFPAWAEEAGGEEMWDFSAESLDRLEALVREMFSTYQDMIAREDEPFVVGAAWYYGEVQVRLCGAVWQCRPEAEDDLPDDPFLVKGEGEGKGEDADADADEDEDAVEYDEDDADDDGVSLISSPSDELRALLRRGEKYRLRDVLSRYGQGLSQTYPRWS
ncbi:hypothetical protein ACTPOK_20470 [Streptomyces inhibens]|uniref:hypothetical protein n=1 Tax=Streptomyces inhibens TaxID=2293571 RepID=UPI00402A611C